MPHKLQNVISTGNVLLNCLIPAGAGQNKLLNIDTDIMLAEKSKYYSTIQKR